MERPDGRAALRLTGQSSEVSAECGGAGKSPRAESEDLASLGASPTARRLRRPASARPGRAWT